jgi:hypothetical protein
VIPLSFGINQKIADSAYYNLGLALPFVCAFYIMNSPSNLIISVIDYELGSDASIFTKIVLIALLYYIIVFYIILASNLSYYMEQSRFYWVLPIAVMLLSMDLYFDSDSKPKVTLIFGVHAALVMLIHLIGDGTNKYISLGVTQILGAIFSLTFFTSGILWYFGNYVFMDAVIAAIGVNNVSEESVIIGGIMLFTMGYVLYYGVFKIGAAVES